MSMMSDITEAQLWVTFRGFLLQLSIPDDGRTGGIVM